MTDAETREMAARWLLLIHQFPAKPAYQRVKIWRRLQALGAVAVKNTVYVLPANEQTQEDFEWLLKEITAGGGDAVICEARLLDGLSDDQIRAMFNVARDSDYDALAKEARALDETIPAEMSPAARADLSFLVFPVRGRNRLPSKLPWPPGCYATACRTRGASRRIPLEATRQMLWLAAIYSEPTVRFAMPTTGMAELKSAPEKTRDRPLFARSSRQ